MQLPLSPTQIALALCIITVGAIIQGSIGFGLGPFGVPLLLLIHPQFVPGPVLFSALFLNILMIRREGYAVKLNETFWALIGRVIGTILAALILKFIAKDILTLYFAAIVLFGCALSLSGLTLAINRINLSFVGLLSGFMGTTSSIGGPPMALLYQKSKGPRIRSALAAIFLIGTILSMLSLVVVDYFGSIELQLSFILLPGVWLGYWLSKFTTPIVDKGFVRPIVLSISVATAVILVIRTLFF